MEFRKTKDRTEREGGVPTETPRMVSTLTPDDVKALIVSLISDYKVNLTTAGRLLLVGGSALSSATSGTSSWPPSASAPVDQFVTDPYKVDFNLGDKMEHLYTTKQ